MNDSIQDNRGVNTNEFDSKSIFCLIWFHKMKSNVIQ